MVRTVRPLTRLAFVIWESFLPLPFGDANHTPLTYPLKAANSNNHPTTDVQYLFCPVYTVGSYSSQSSEWVRIKHPSTILKNASPAEFSKQRVCWTNSSSVILKLQDVLAAAAPPASVRLGNAIANVGPPAYYFWSLCCVESLTFHIQRADSKGLPCCCWAGGASETLITMQRCPGSSWGRWPGGGGIRSRRSCFSLAQASIVWWDGRRR